MTNEFITPKQVAKNLIQTIEISRKNYAVEMEQKEYHPELQAWMLKAFDEMALANINAMAASLGTSGLKADGERGPVGLIAKDVV